MHPDAKKAQKILDDEIEANRKLNNSAVMPVEDTTGEHKAPSGLVNLFEKYGQRDNKKAPPKKENKFYQALTGGRPMQQPNKTVPNNNQPASTMRSKATTTPPKISKLDLQGKVTGAAQITGGTGTNNTNSY